MTLQVSQKSRISSLSEYVAETQFKDLPREVIQQAKSLLLDTLGAIIRASSTKYSAGRILEQLCRDLGGKEECSLIGKNLKTNLVNATLTNGTMGYYCDVESHHAESITHVAAVIVPTALAVAQSRGLSGADVLKALVIGYDVETRVSNALGPNALYKRGFHPSAVAGCFGAAATAGSLLGLNSERQTMAFGLAGCQASGLLAWETDQTENSRPFQMGVAARNGTTSALLAEKGFGAPPDVLGGKDGMFGAFTDDPEPDRLTENLGRQFTILEAAFKLYSCCAFIHPGADGLLSIMSKNKLRHEDISEIILHFPKPGASIIDNNELKSHNSQYILPILAVQGQVNIEDILQERRSDPEIARLSKNTRLIHDEELGPLFPEKYTSIVRVKTKQGKEYSEKVDYARGTPKNPVTLEEIQNKFRRLTAGELLEEKIERCIRMCDEFDRFGRIDELFAITSR